MYFMHLGYLYSSVRKLALLDSFTTRLNRLLKGADETNPSAKSTLTYKVKVLRLTFFFFFSKSSINI